MSKQPIKYIHIRINFYQSIRIGFGIALGFMVFQLAFSALTSLLLLALNPFQLPI